MQPTFLTGSGKQEAGQARPGGIESQEASPFTQRKVARATPGPGPLGRRRPGRCTGSPHPRRPWAAPHPLGRPALRQLTAPAPAAAPHQHPAPLRLGHLRPLSALRVQHVPALHFLAARGGRGAGRCSARRAQETVLGPSLQGGRGPQATRVHVGDLAFRPRFLPRPVPFFSLNPRGCPATSFGNREQGPRSSVSQGEPRAGAAGGPALGLSRLPTGHTLRLQPSPTLTLPCLVLGAAGVC